MDEEIVRQLELAEDNEVVQPTRVISREISTDTSLLRLRFAKEYIRCSGNGAEAAQRAGYGGTRATLARKASQLLRSSDVQGYLTEHVRGAMDAREVVARLAQIARGSIGDFLVIDPDSGQCLGFDFRTPQAKESIGLIKKLKHTKTGCEIELYSKLGALELLVRALQMDDAERDRKTILEEVIENMPHSIREPFIQLLATFSDPIAIPGVVSYTLPDEPPDADEDPEIDQDLCDA